MFVLHVPFSGFIDINGCSWGSATDFHRTVDDCTDVSTDGKDQLVGIVGALSDVQVAAFVPAGYGKGAIPRTYIAGTCVQQSCLPGVIKPIGSSRSKELAVGGRGDGDLFPHLADWDPNGTMGKKIEPRQFRDGTKLLDLVCKLRRQRLRQEQMRRRQ